MAFPFFFMCVFMLPLYYLITKLAEERENNSKEGMLMMGLNENSYYKAWFVMYSTITFFTSLEVTFVLSIEAF